MNAIPEWILASGHNRGSKMILAGGDRLRSFQAWSQEHEAVGRMLKVVNYLIRTGLLADNMTRVLSILPVYFLGLVHDRSSVSKGTAPRNVDYGSMLLGRLKSDH